MDSGGSVLAAYILAVALLLVPGIGVTIWQRHYIRLHVASLPAAFHALWLKQAALGLALGLGLVTVTVLPAWLGGAFDPAQSGWEGFESGSERLGRISSGGLMLLFGFQSAYEELLYRTLYMGLFGLLLLWLLRLLDLGGAGGTLHRGAWFGAGAAASAVVAAAFGLSHAGNPHAEPLALVNIGLAGLLLGLVVWYHGNVWGAWALHFSWNATLALLGLPVSGMRAAAGGPFAGAAPGLLSGGQFGPEASLQCSLGLALAAACVVWLMARGGARTERDPADNRASEPPSII